MRLSFSRGTVAAGLVASLSAVPAVLVAQPGGVSAACSVDPNSPKDLALLELPYQKAKSAPSAEARQSALKSMIKELDTKPERFAKNPAGYNYRLAQVYTMWAAEPGIGYSPNRAAIGFLTDPSSNIDLVKALDDSFKAIVAAIPACETQIAGDRRSEVWLGLTNKAIQASGSGQLDSAEYFAKRSLMLVAESPYPYHVLATVANAKKDRATAITNWKRVVKEAESDTLARPFLENSLQMLGVTQLDMAEAASGAERVTLARESAANFKRLLSSSPDTPEVQGIMMSISDAMRLSGDSANIPSIYADMLAKPAGYSDGALTMGGVIAVRVNKTDDAVALFEAALKKNPQSRDALRNVVEVYFSKDQYQKMFTPLRGLVGIEPNNYDAWMRFAYAWQGFAKAVKMPEVKKGAVPTPAERKLMEAAATERKTFNDSTNAYMAIAEALPVKVDITSFTRGAKDVTLQMQFEQQGAADGTYSVTVEFLDAKGAVVGTATSSVGPLKKGQPKTVNFKAAATNVAGYRYKAIK
jgi:tetratricopeptide (TPR) repeat protein